MEDWIISTRIEGGFNWIGLMYKKGREFLGERQQDNKKVKVGFQWVQNILNAI